MCGPLLFFITYFLLINHNQGYTGCVQLVMCRSISQVFSATVLLAVHTYFPDMLLLRLFSFRVPVFSSKTAVYMEKTVKHTWRHIISHVYAHTQQHKISLQIHAMIWQIYSSNKTGASASYRKVKMLLENSTNQMLPYEQEWVVSDSSQRCAKWQSQKTVCRLLFYQQFTFIANNDSLCFCCALTEHGWEEDLRGGAGFLPLVQRDRFPRAWHADQSNISFYLWLPGHRALRNRRRDWRERIM